MKEDSRPARVIVIGASAGGVEALSRLAADLPPDIPAAVLMVLHIGERSFLPELLARVSALPVAHARRGEQLETARIYVAPPEGTCWCMIPTCCCQGPLWEITDARPLRYRCHTGHAFTAETMLEAQSEEAEHLLWGLLRSHQQRAAMTMRLAQDADGTRFGLELRQRAEDYGRNAEMIRGMIERDVSPLPDEADADGRTA